MKYNSFISTALFIVCPLLALPFILNGIYNQKKYAYALFALFWGVMAFLTLPFADLYRHFILFQNIEASPYALSELFSEGLFNWFIPFCYLMMNQFSIPFDFLRMVEVFTSLIMLFDIFKKYVEISNVSYTKKEYFQRFLILFLFFDFLFTTESVRFGWALCFCLYGYFLLFYRQRRILAIAFLAFAAFIHYTFYMFIISTFIIYRLNFSSRNVLIYCLCFSLLINIGINQISALLGTQGSWYLTDSSENGNSYGDLTIIGLTMYFALKFSIYPFVKLYIKDGNQVVDKNAWCKLFNSWLVISVMFISSQVVFQRAVWVVMALGPFMLLCIESKVKQSHRIIKLFISFGIFFTIANGLNNHKIVFNSNYNKIIYPLPVILAEPYDESWVNQHVDGNDILKENHWFGF